MLAAVRLQHDLDRHQADAVFKRAHTKVRPRQSDPTQAEWNQFIDQAINRVALDLDVEQDAFERVAVKMNAAKAELPDARTYATLQEINLRADKAISAIRRQINAAAALRGVTPEEVAERFTAFRAQYLKDLHSLPAAERPDPPAEWVTGFTTKDMMAVSAPADPATLYAMYRCQADPDAYPSTAGARYASIDLETAGPSGKAGFNPENGSIIEVGIIEYDHNGVEMDRYAQLVAPSAEVAAACGTGAVDVHGIRPEDVANAPSWTQVAPMVAERLHGRVLLAQNARFEQDWLSHHMHNEDQPFDRWAPTTDTMCIARQHMSSLPDRRLATVCEAVGVDYTNGHRALHDADVTGRAFFAIRNRIFNGYRSSPVHTNTPAPAYGYGAPTNRRPKITSMRDGDFSPATVEDPWAPRPPVAQPA